jgi:hypothetical protein
MAFGGTFFSLCLYNAGFYDVGFDWSVVITVSLWCAVSHHLVADILRDDYQMQ